MANRILIIEDEVNIARFIELELIHEGNQVVKAFDGREIHLDKRKQIVKAIEIYSQNKIIK